MNNEKYNQIIDEVYEIYINKLNYNEKDCHVDDLINKPNKTIVPYNQEEFINKCKTDPEFSEKWRLKIEEREFSLKDRLLLLFKKLSNEMKLAIGNDGPKFDVGFDPSKYTTHEDCDKENIPTKLITLTYQNEKIEVYE